jgi:5-formyltetrahydrofolate cyclo-ligase
MVKPTNSSVKSLPSNQKNILRREKRLQRRALNFQQQQQAAQALNRQLGRDPTFIRAKDIVFYFANDGEIDPIFLLKRAHRMGKRCYLPILSAGNTLQFSRYRPGGELCLNQFGIPEPVNGIRRKPWLQCLILLPLVAFDRHGGRLGMGGGFYDRSLAGVFSKHKKNRLSKKPILLGLAHHCQEVEQLPMESWDIPLSGIVTDREFIQV